MYIQHTALKATQPQSVLSLNITVCQKNQGTIFSQINLIKPGRPEWGFFQNAAIPIETIKCTNHLLPS